MMSHLTMSLRLMADSSNAISVVQNYVTPTMQALIAIASIASVFFIVYGGILYMTSSGRPEKLEQAKLVIKNTFIGIAIIIGAGVLTAILSNAMTQNLSPGGAMLPNLESIQPAPSSNGLIDLLIGAVTGLLNNIIQAVAVPFIGSLDYFTKETPLMVSNASVFNLWLAVVGITDVLFVVVLALVGFHVMSASTFGFEEIDIKHLLPRIGLIFLLMNTSIFIIDSFIELSNVLIVAVGHIGGGSTAWSTLTSVVQDAGGQSVAALLVMLVFLIFSVILLVYYVGRLVTLFIGTVLSPLVLLIWLVPGFRDFSETAAKTFLTTVFVLFIHVVILQLASSLFAGMGVSGASGDVPNVLMSMIVGLATVIALLKTQGLMMQFSYVSLGARSTRQLSTQFMHGVSYLGSRGRNAFNSVSGKMSGSGSSRASTASKSLKSQGMQSIGYKSPNSSDVKVTRVAAPTGTTYKAPGVNTASPRSSAKNQVNVHHYKSNKEKKL
jgi:hypothetical protein